MDAQGINPLSELDLYLENMKDRENTNHDHRFIITDQNVSNRNNTPKNTQMFSLPEDTRPISSSHTIPSTTFMMSHDSNFFMNHDTSTIIDLVLDQLEVDEHNENTDMELDKNCLFHSNQPPCTNYRNSTCNRASDTIPWIVKHLKDDSESEQFPTIEEEQPYRMQLTDTKRTTQSINFRSETDQCFSPSIQKRHIKDIQQKDSVLISEDSFDDWKRQRLESFPSKKKLSVRGKVGQLKELVPPVPSKSDEKEIINGMFCVID